MSSPHARPLALALALLLAACAADDDAGTAPTIGSLSLMPMQIVVGTATTVTGEVAFTDPDGDVETLEIEVTAPGGMPSTVEVEVTGADGVAEGTVQFMLMLTAPAAGEYPVEVRLVDAQGNTSPGRTGTLTAT